MTSTECLYSCLPMIIINPIPGQEEKNLEYFVNNGMAIEYTPVEDISDIVSVVINNPLRVKQMKEMCMHLRKEHACENIVDVILKVGD